MAELFYIESHEDRPWTPWDFKKSIFAAYWQDNEQTLNECFEFDWSMIWLPKGLISEKQMGEFKDLMRANYWKIKDCYRYYSGLGESNNIY